MFSSYYAKIKKEEEEKMAELAEKYRDRAKERREGKNPDYQAEDPSQAGMGGYRAVAPDLKSYVLSRANIDRLTLRLHCNYYVYVYCCCCYYYNGFVADVL